MYKVLIAEDEILVRLGLANSIPWEQLGMVLTAQASNGMQAYELFLSEHPDVIITDIRMPLMDGMELIRKIRETDASCKIIIITCVEEFEYARQAISYQVEDYILKLTMDMSEIETILSKVRTALDESHLVRKADSLPEAARDTSLLAELYDCLCGYRSHFSFNRFPFFSDSFQVAFIRILLMRQNVPEEYKPDRICTDKSLYQLLQRQLEHDHGILIEKAPGDYFFLFHNESSFLGDFDSVITLTRNYFNARPICGISPSVPHPDELGKAGQCAQACLSQYFFYPQEYLFRADAHLKPDVLKADIPARINKIFLSFSDSYPCIRQLWSEYADHIRKFLSDSPVDCEHIRKLFYYLADYLLDRLALNHNCEPADNCVYNYHRYIFEASNIESIYYIFERLLHKLLSLTDTITTLSKEMAEIIRYIEQHYMENLTLDILSTHVNYSRGYLCSIFRRELNTSFGNYLTKVRISHAKQLLTSSFLRLYEIAEQTGFYDYSHFARTFKKVTGFSPQEYQNHQSVDTQEDAE